MSRLTQSKLFDDAALPPDPLPWELAAETDRLCAQVVLNRPVDTIFHYVVPDKLREMIAPGQRLAVPFGKGNQSTVGYCVGTSRAPQTGRELKSVESILDREPLLSPHMLTLTRWIADYYLCGWGQVIESVVPAAVKKKAGTRLVRFYQAAPQALAALESGNLPAKQRAVLEVLRSAATAMSVEELTKLAGCGTGPINALRDKGLIQAIQQRVERSGSSASDSPTQTDLTLNRDQQFALESIVGTLRAGEHRTILLHGVTGSGKTEVYIQAVREVVAYGRQAIVLVPEISLTPQTIQRFRSRFSSVAVMHSHLSDAERHWHWQQIARGGVQVVVGARSAVFAPTPHLGLIVIDEEHETTFKQETTPRYHAREVARQRALLESVPLVLGSATPTLESWLRVTKNETRGRGDAETRGEENALRAPRSEFRAPPSPQSAIRNPQFPSAMNQPAYADRSPVTQSAFRTPHSAFDSTANPQFPLAANQPAYAGRSPNPQSDILISLPKRVERRPLPPVIVVDIRNDPHCRRGEAIGRALHSAMRTALEDGGQIILFLNLRGFSPVMWCSICSKTVRCPNCEVTLTWHKDRNVVLCHSCDYHSAPPSLCPHCGKAGLRYLGTGTQRLEAEVRGKFSGVPCLRMDSDAMRKHGSHDEALRRFREGEVRILLGTQMIAKGLDFPNVTLVGVIDTDTMLHQPEMRAAERTFQLISQVAGRTGRSARGGRVFVQSSSPAEPAILYAARHDYLGFAAAELRHRREIGMPPFSHLARVIIRSRNEEQACQHADQIAIRLRAANEKSGGSVRILGPAIPGISRLKSHFRYHIQLAAEDVESIRRLWRAVADELPKSSAAEHVIDVDPINMR